MTLFDKRVNLKPYEYPQFSSYVDAIRNSYWIHSEFNFTSDIQDFKTELSENEQQVVKRTLLAIAQIEVDVKTFWKNVGNYFPKPEIDAVGVTFAECHKEGTEILTPKGFIDFREIEAGDEVGQWKDGKIEWTKCSHKTEKHFKGDMLRLKKTTLDACVTPNHRIVYKEKGEMKEQEAGKISWSNTSFKLPESGMLDNGVETKGLTNLERLFIAIQADGCERMYRKKNGERVNRGLSSGCHTYEITVSKDRKKDRIREILSGLGLKTRTFDIAKSEYLKMEIDIPTSLGTGLKEFEWVDLSDKDAKWCEEFIQEIAEWDGHRLPHKKDCKIKYSTTNKFNADVVQTIGTCAGYRANLTTYVDNRSEKFKDVYIVSFTSNREFTTFGPVKSTPEQYEGKVYCVTVPSGVIITRYNDKTFISGNSEARHADAYSHLLEILGLNGEFDNISQIPAIQGRIDYLEKSKGKDIVKSLLLFSLFIEHISLFSQFLIVMSFNKERNVLKGISNVIEATSKEENIHGLFGTELINVLREEHPDMFTPEMKSEVYELANKALTAEVKILDWIFEDGELSFLSKSEIKEFIKDRFNKSLLSVGYSKLFHVEEEKLENLEWFEDELNSTKHGDFFVKKSVNYNKKNKSITEFDLFD